MKKLWIAWGLLIALPVYSQTATVEFPNADFDQTTTAVFPGGFDVPDSDVPGWMDYGSIVDSGVECEGAWWSPYQEYSGFMKSGDGAYLLSDYTIQAGDYFSVDFYAKGWRTYNNIPGAKWRVTLFYGDDPSVHVIGTYQTGALVQRDDTTAWAHYHATIPATHESVGQTLGILFESTGPDGSFANLDEVSIEVASAAAPFKSVNGSPTGVLHSNSATIEATVIEGTSIVDTNATYLVLDGTTNQAWTLVIDRSAAPATTISYDASGLSYGLHVCKLVVAGAPHGSVTKEWKFSVARARPTVSRAVTHYVDINSKNPRAPYLTWQTAANNVQDALNVIGNDDTVLVANGTYNLSPGITIMRGTLKSVNGPSSTILKGNGSGRVVFLESHGTITLDGFTVTGGDSTGDHSHGGGILAKIRAHVTISNCIVEYNKTSSSGGGISVSASRFGDSISVNIANCIIRHNEAKSCGGITTRLLGTDTGSVTIESCLIYENRAERNIGGIGGGNGQYAQRELTKVVNCTIWGNESGNWGGGVAGCGVYNSIVCNNHSDHANLEAGEFRVFKGNMLTRWHDIGQCKDIVNTCSPDAPRGHGNISGNPRFVNPEKGDFRLMHDSPCIEAGDNQHVMQSVDLAGNPRLMDADPDGDAIVDLGAYEYVVLPVEIDIRPGSGSKVINRRERGLLPVAILATDSFPVTEIDPASIRFADAKPQRWIMRDVDQDDDVDLLLVFQPNQLRLKSSSTQVFLTGQTKDKQPFIGKSPIVLSND